MDFYSSADYKLNTIETLYETYSFLRIVYIIFVYVSLFFLHEVKPPPKKKGLTKEKLLEDGKLSARKALSV